MPDPTPERIAAALALAEAVDAQTGETQRSYRVTLALEAYRTTAPKPETVREIIEGWRRADPDGNNAMLLRLVAALDREPTTPTDSGPSSDSAPPSALPAGAAYSRQADIAFRFLTLVGCSAYGKGETLHINVPPSPGDALIRQALDLMVEFSRASGPRPIPATKESSDTAGVDAGVANPEDDGPRYVPWHCPLNCECRAAPASEPNRVTDHDADQREPEVCSCEESEALKDTIRELRRLLGFAHKRAEEIVQALETLP